MSIRIVSCECGKKFYAVPYFSFSKRCPSCNRPLTQDGNGELLSDGKPCLSTAYPINALNYFTINYPEIDEKIYLVHNNYFVEEMQWGLMFSPANFDRTSLFRNYLGWIRR